MNPRLHPSWGLASEWIAAMLGASEEQTSLIMEVLAAAIEHPEKFSDTPFSELPPIAKELRQMLDEPREALGDFLGMLGEAMLPALEPIVSSPPAADMARELLASLPSVAVETPNAAPREEVVLPPVASEAVPASPTEAAPLLAQRLSEELNAWSEARWSRQHPARLRERLRLVSSVLRRSGYRTFGTLASELDATLDDQLRSEAPPPESIFIIFRECTELIDSMARRDFPRHRTHYAICARLEQTRREITKAAQAALAARRAAPSRANAPKKSASTLPKSKKLSPLDELFLEEMSSHLDDMTRFMLLAESDPGNRDAIFAIMRSAHSIKGSAAIVGFKEISRLGHALEDLMVLVRDEQLFVTADIANVVFATADRLNALRQEAETGAEPSTDRTDALIERLNAMTANVSANLDAYRSGSGVPIEMPGVNDTQDEEKRHAPATNVISVDVRHLDHLMNIAADLVIGRTRLTAQLSASALIQDRITRELDQASQLGLRLKRFLELERNNVGATVPARSQSEFEPAELDQFNAADLAVRDIREGMARINDEVESLRSATRELDARLGLVAALVTDLRESVRRARLLPIGQLFDRFPRAIRDLSHKLHKPIELKISGEGTLLDKLVLDELADPLMHLVRNAADHGIESADERQAAGKPRAGTIRLAARQAGGHAVIEVSDDGAGIDVNRVRAKAIDRGWMTPAEAQAAKDEALFALLLKSGFSTAAAVTDISGRGVGLDVVANTVELLKGSLTIQSQFGKGTTFVVRLPVSLSIAQGLLVRLGDDTYAIPIDAVEEAVFLNTDDMRSIAGQPVLILRGRPIPLLDLRQHFGVTTPRSDEYGPYVLVVGEARARSGLVIDSIAGIEEFVQKGFGDFLGPVDYMAGATVLADGRVTMILDAVQLGSVLSSVQSDLSAMESRATPSESVEELLEAPLPVDSTLSESAEVDLFSHPAHPVLEALPSTSQLSIEAPRPQAPRSTPHILAVDDSVSVRRYVAGILQEAGFEVTMAVDGIDALEKLAVDTFDLILTDLEMPRMHGFELITEIKAAPRLRRVPIVILTGRMGEKHSRKGLELGANAYLVKPFDEAVLVATIRDCLNRKDGDS